MAVYDFERLSVFLVDDNAYVRDTLIVLLRHLGFGRVITANNGEEAVNMLKLPVDGSHLAADAAPDIIISDLIMMPINGLLFLKWLRSSKDSPNRFTPFIMLSGAADLENLHASLELGTTEFIAKPFSVTSVSGRILEIIDYPRQFVATEKYFGPDRRRRKVQSKTERRKVEEKDVTIVYSPDKVVKPKHPTDVWYFRLPNTLKDRVGGLGVTGPGEIPTALLEEAEAQLERAMPDFAEWAAGYLAELSKLAGEAAADETNRPSRFEKINLLAHELRGQGGTFGYPLISIFGKMLFEVTDSRRDMTDSAVKIITAHIDAMRAVIRDKVAGDGGQLGRDLLAGLRAAIDKHSMVK